MATSSPAVIIPARPFAAILAGLVVVLVLLGTMRLVGHAPEANMPASAADAVRMLQVEDGAQGVVVVRDATTGQHIKTFRRAEGSFLRATFRALVNDRRRKGVTSGGDFRLESRSGGQLYLTDEATGRRLALNAYGPDNSAVFAEFISNQRGEGQ